MDNLKNSAPGYNPTSDPASEPNSEPASDSANNPDEKPKESFEKQEVFDARNVNTHSFALEAVDRLLPAERTNEIRSELAQIDDIVENKTVEALEYKGELPASFASTERSLLASGFNPSLLTPQEAKDLDNYINNASEDIKEHKRVTIAGMVAKMRQGVKHRRTYSLNSDMEEEFDALTEKNERYERGELDTECGFDKERYLGGDDDDDYYNYHSYESTDDDDYDEYESRHARSQFEKGNISDLRGGDSDYGSRSGRAYKRLARDMGVTSEIDRMIETLDFEELVEEGIVNPEDQYVYGGYTYRDCNTIVRYQKNNFVSSIDFRNTSKTGELLKKTIPARETDIETDLANNYVATEILPSRRPSAKNMISMFASVGIEYTNIGKETLNAVASDEQKKTLKSDLTWGLYNVAKILEMDVDSIKNRYGGRARPIEKGFFEEILKRSEALTDMQVEDIEKRFSSYLTKLDGRLAGAGDMMSELSLKIAKRKEAALDAVNAPEASASFDDYSKPENIGDSDEAGSEVFGGIPLLSDSLGKFGSEAVNLPDNNSDDNNEETNE